jgi:hypothetical protein
VYLWCVYRGGRLNCPLQPGSPHPSQKRVEAKIIREILTINQGQAVNWPTLA